MNMGRFSQPEPYENRDWGTSDASERRQEMADRRRDEEIDRQIDRQMEIAAQQAAVLGKIIRQLP